MCNMKWLQKIYTGEGNRQQKQDPIRSLGIQTSFASSQGLTAKPGLPREPERVIVPPRAPHLRHEAQKRIVLTFYLMMFQLLTVEMEICPNLWDSQIDLAW